MPRHSSSVSPGAIGVRESIRPTVARDVEHRIREQVDHDMAVRHHPRESRFLAVVERVPVVADHRPGGRCCRRPPSWVSQRRLRVSRAAHAGAAIEDVEQLVIALRIGLSRTASSWPLISAR